MIRNDVVIVGGGPAGSACAWALRKHGIQTIVLDREPFPRLKLCAGWVTPRVWQHLGVRQASYPYGLTTLGRLRVSVRGRALEIRARQQAIRRVEFDHWLLQRAGVPVALHQVRSIVERDGGYLVDGTYWGKYLVGAGGTHCPVARTFFNEVNPRSERALIVTLEEEFPYKVRNDACHLWFFDDGLPGYAWYVPKAGGYVNVGVGGKAARLRARDDTIRRHWELLVVRLEALNLVRGYRFRPRGHAYYLREARRTLRRDNAMVIGDAAGLATMDMGEGIEPAIMSGLLAAEAIVHNKDIDVSKLRRWSQPFPIGPLLAWALG